MTITGGIKFFEPNAMESATITASGPISAGESNLIDGLLDTHWQAGGVGGYQIDFEFESQAIDRIFLLNHNLKGYSIQYWNGSAWAFPANFITINSASILAGGDMLQEDGFGILQEDGFALLSQVDGDLVETSYAMSSSYLEFDRITTTKLRLSIFDTQDSQPPFLAEFVAATEILTFEGYPQLTFNASRNVIEHQVISGRSRVQKSSESTEFGLSFSTYPLQADLDFIQFLYDLDSPVLIWPCGGRTGSEFFTNSVRPYLLSDLKKVESVSRLSTNYVNGILTNPVNGSLTLVEVP